MAPQPPQPRSVPSRPPHSSHIGPPTLASAAPAGGAVAARPTFSNNISRWLKISGMAGLVISAAFHLVILSVAAVIVLAHAGGSAETGGGAPVQFAVLNESELAELAGGNLETDAPAVPDAPASELPAIDIQIPEAVGLDAMRESLETAGGGTGAGDISAGGDGLGGPGSGGGAGGGGAGFFGVEATGSRFAYIVDVSGSMAVGGKMEAMTSELMRSINALLENNHRFMIVPFSSDAAPLGGRTGWIDASESGRSWARRAVMDLQAVGGTNPSPGFFYVFSQTPKPDAIYFLTDGEFNPVTVQEIAGLNGDHDVPIHTICFGTRDAEPLMKRIAEQSGGLYTFIAVGSGP